MDFVGAIQAGFKNYANFRGVATRPEFWYFFLFTFLASLVLAVVDGFLDTTIGVGFVFNVMTLIPSLSVLVRRLRDASFSWFWILAPITSVVLMTIGVIGISYIIMQSGVYTLDSFLNADNISDAEITAFINANEGLIGFGLLTLAGALLTLVTGLVVNIIFPILPSKSFEEGNKLVKPENPNF